MGQVGSAPGNYMTAPMQYPVPIMPGQMPNMPTMVAHPLAQSLGGSYPVPFTGAYPPPFPGGFPPQQFGGSVPKDVAFFPTGFNK